MAIRAVVFDIGGVLEITPRTGWTEKWEKSLHLEPGGLNARLGNVWRDGSLGRCSEADVEERVGRILGIDRARVDALMDNLWEEYLGMLNVELAAYFARLRPRYRTGILSNSFVGAREREQERYRFGELCDLIIYSHEEGLEKPDPRFYALACTRLGVEPGEVAFLDDVAGHVLAARECGIHAILFRETAQAIADLDACFAADGNHVSVMP
jgi:epoxide hydrolase-like predicted phosphatase